MRLYPCFAASWRQIRSVCIRFASAHEFVTVMRRSGNCRPLRNSTASAPVMLWPGSSGLYRSNATLRPDRADAGRWPRGVVTALENTL